MFNWWQNPPVTPIVKVHVFNYSNFDRYMIGDDEKIKVVELGPYTYREIVKKIHMKIHNDAISFNVSFFILKPV